MGLRQKHLHRLRCGKLIQHSEIRNPTLVVVTDQNDLDGQLYETFFGAQELLKQTLEKADSVRAKMRILIKRLLKKYKYPPEGQEEAVTLVLQQAEALADDWSRA